MIFEETPLAGAYTIDLDPAQDERGFFARAWAHDAFVERGLNPEIAQINMSKTLKAGTFRGFHWQDPPFGETKTIRCVAGSVFNCIVDMRPDSATYTQWFGVELSAQNGRALYLPEQFANGFLITSDNTVLLYHVSRPYEPGNERGMRWDDPLISVDWPHPVRHVSEKDQTWPDFERD